MNLSVTVSRAEFARIVGVSAGRVSQLVRSNVLDDKGTLADWLLSYCDQLRTHAAGRASSGPLDLTQERAALAQAQRRIAEIKRRQLDDELIEVEAVRNHWSGMATRYRDCWLLLPHRLGSLLAMRDAEFVVRALDEEVRKILTDLSEGGDGVPRRHGE
jgi:phage terminase Nu1 subunit (DNA packaging protein)